MSGYTLRGTVVTAFELISNVQVEIAGIRRCTPARESIPSGVPDLWYYFTYLTFDQFMNGF